MNDLPNVWTRRPSLTLKGPVLRSHRYNERFQTFMDYFECAVVNGAQLPQTLFGAFAEVRNRGNSNEAWLEVWVAPGFFEVPSAPIFEERTRLLFNVNEYIKEAKEVKTIVAEGSAIVTTPDTWEASLEPIDGVHALQTLIEVVTLNVINAGERDDQLNSSHQINTSLVPAATATAASDYPSGLNVDTSDGGTHSWVEYTEVRCGWFERRAEGMTTDEGYVYNTTRSYFWPDVMTFFEVAILNGEDENGEVYVASILLDVRYDESYNGPCKASITRAWVASPTAALAPTAMITDSFDYQGIFFNYQSRDCLHPQVDITESVNDHPTLQEGQFRVKSFPATDTHTAWPATVTFYEDPVPYKGGYIEEKVVITAPVATA